MIIGNKIIELKKTTSTNFFISDLIKKEDVKDGTVVITGFQELGKGHSGSKWESEPGKNLLLSILLIPDSLEADQQFYISKFVSLAICKFVRKFIHDSYIKWPNDIICNNKKICGILIENVIKQSQITSSIIGIGLNVNQEKFNVNMNATSLFLEIRNKIDLKQAFSNLISHLNNEYKKLINKKFEQIDLEYLRMLFQFEKWSNYKKDEQIFEGKIKSISSNGELIMEKRNGEVTTFGFKEVIFL